jgi:hypothetical protein
MNGKIRRLSRGLAILLCGSVGELSVKVGGRGRIHVMLRKREGQELGMVWYGICANSFVYLILCTYGDQASCLEAFYLRMYLFSAKSMCLWDVCQI